jgi:Mitochondrial carrier protein
MSCSRVSSLKIASLSLLFSTHPSFALVPPALVHTAVGFLAGSSGAIAAYPIDYCKSVLQTEEGRAKYKGGFAVAADIVRSNGPFALYRGLWVNVVGIAPEKTIKLTANSMMRGFLTAQLGYLPLMGEVFAGGFAGATQVVVTNPLEVVKVKLQTSQMTVQEVLREVRGLADLYQGAGACIVRDVVFSAVLFPLYAHLKVAFLAVLLGIAPGESARFWADLLAGSIAAGPAAFIATPADVVKTRLQQARNEDTLYSLPRGLAEANNAVNAGETSSIHRTATTRQVRMAASSQVSAVTNTHATEHVDSSSANNRTSFFHVTRDLVREEGPEVLFSGWFERVVRSVPQFGVTLAVYDLLNTYAISHGWLQEQVAK